MTIASSFKEISVDFSGMDSVACPLQNEPAGPGTRDRGPGTRNQGFMAMRAEVSAP